MIEKNKTSKTLRLGHGQSISFKPFDAKTAKPAKFFGALTVIKNGDKSVFYLTREEWEELQEVLRIG